MSQVIFEHDDKIAEKKPDAHNNKSGNWSCFLLSSYWL